MCVRLSEGETRGGHMAMDRKAEETQVIRTDSLALQPPSDAMHKQEQRRKRQFVLLQVGRLSIQGIQ